MAIELKSIWRRATRVGDQARLVAGAAAAVARRRLRGERGRPTWDFGTELGVEVLRAGMRRVAEREIVELRRFVDARVPPSFVMNRVTRRAGWLAGVPVVRFAPRHRRAERTVLYLHGGAFVFGSEATHADLCARIALAARAEVVFVEYRLAPEHTFPAAWDDCFAAYNGLLAEGVDPRRVIVAGDSAGGGLSLSLLLRLRDEQKPMPAGAALISPWLEPGDKGGTLDSHLDFDWLPATLGRYGEAYAGATSIHDPRISPGRAELRGLPPILLQVGGAEILVDQGRRLAARCQEHGVPCEHDEVTDMVHVWHMLAAFNRHARDAIARIGAFAREVTP